MFPSSSQAIPDERLEAEITELAGQLAAATCRWLGLIAEFDRRRGWESWGVASCAHWLNWRCGLSLSAAYEHVRVALQLARFPVIAEAFGSGQLSYSKVRAMTRMAEPQTEATLVEWARSMTASQVDRLARGWRKVGVDEARRRQETRSFRWFTDDAGMVVFQGRLPPEDAALVIAALEASRDAMREESSPDSSAEELVEGSQLPVEADDPWAAANADALVNVAGSVLANGITSPDGSNPYQIVVEADTAALLGDDHGRARIEHGASIASETLRRLACDACIVPIKLGADGSVLDVGRKTRTINRAMRRAMRKRDGGCCFPGCTNRRFVQAHHVVYWTRGGRTNLGNLISLCHRHHVLIHEGGFTIATGPDGIAEFFRPDGTPVRPRPAPACASHGVADANRSAGVVVTPETCIPEWYGGQLDVGLAIDSLVCQLEAVGS